VSGLEVVASVIGAFFFIGIGVGVLLVIALPALHRRRDARGITWDGDYHRRYGPPTDYGDDNGLGWEEPPAPDEGDNPPRLPDRRG
jgi:hypothetical protein